MKPDIFSEYELVWSDGRTVIVWAKNERSAYAKAPGIYARKFSRERPTKKTGPKVVGIRALQEMKQLDLVDMVRESEFAAMRPLGVR